MKKSAVLMLFPLLLAVALPSGAEEVTFLYMKQSGYDLADIVDRAQSFERATGIHVNPVFVEYKDRYTLIADSARKAKPDFDLVLLDLIWTADFARHGIIDPLPEEQAAAVREGIVPSISEAFQFEDRLWALPFHVDFQLLYTNLDLLQKAGFTRPPRTIEEMTRMAREAKRRGVIAYPLFDSWNEQEVLVCELTWLVGAFGGSLTDARGRIDCSSAPCVNALRYMVSLLKEGLMNPYSLQSEENFTSEVFQAGDSMFTTNWSYLIRLLQGDRGGVRWALTTLPVTEAVAARGALTSSVSGFEGLAVTARSAHKEAAWRFARWLDSPEFQGRHLEFMPVWNEVWGRPETRQNDPFLAVKQAQIAGLHDRPVNPSYRQVSAVLQLWMFKALTGLVSPEQALQEAQAGIDTVTGQVR